MTERRNDTPPDVFREVEKPKIEVTVLGDTDGCGNDFRDKKMKEASWPVELQGHGESEGMKKFKVSYPRGDYFLSFVTLIHELGHLGQDDLNEEIRKQKGIFLSWNTEKERDAWRRGWNYLVDVKLEGGTSFLQHLESKFKQYNLPFKSFADLYKWCQKKILPFAVESFAVSQKYRGCAPKKELEPVWKKFIQEHGDEYKGMRVGEAIDIDLANKLIEKVILRVIAELKSIK